MRLSVDTTEAYDALYGLLVALCDHETVAPPPNLMAAFTLVAEVHEPSELWVPVGLHFDVLLDEAVLLVRMLFDRSINLGERTRLTALRLLLASVAVEPGRPRPGAVRRSPQWPPSLACRSRRSTRRPEPTPSVNSWG